VNTTLARTGMIDFRVRAWAHRPTPAIFRVRFALAEASYEYETIATFVERGDSGAPARGGIGGFRAVSSPVRAGFAVDISIPEPSGPTMISSRYLWITPDSVWLEHGRE
jgi:hypothetical protein